MMPLLVLPKIQEISFILLPVCFVVFGHRRNLNEETAGCYMIKRYFFLSVTHFFLFIDRYANHGAKHEPKSSAAGER